MGTVKQDFFIILPFDQDRQRTWLPGALPFGFYFGGRAAAHMGAALHYFCRAGPVCPAGGAGKIRSGRCGERTERCQWQRKRSERVAAVKILSVRRKAAQKFWAPQQDHRPLRRFGKKVPAWNPPVTASPCQPPLGKGAEGTGDADCHSRYAHRLRNDTL